MLIFPRGGMLSLMLCGNPIILDNSWDIAGDYYLLNGMDVRMLNSFPGLLDRHVKTWILKSLK